MNLDMPNFTELYASQAYNEYQPPNPWEVDPFYTLDSRGAPTHGTRQQPTQTYSIQDFIEASIDNGLLQPNTHRVQSYAGSTQQHQQRQITTRCNHDPAAFVKLSTGELMKPPQFAKRVHFAGFPEITTPIPDGVQDEEIITDWPNHLWGPLLLRIVAKYSPKEIGNLNEVKLRANTIVKRTISAKKEAGIVNDKKKEPKASGTKRKRASEEDGNEKKEPKKEPKKKKPKQGVSDKAKGKETNETSTKKDWGPESEAARAMRLEQERLHSAFWDKDPDFHIQQATVKKKNKKRQRDILDEVFREVEANKAKKTRKSCEFTGALGIARPFLTDSVE